MKRLIYLSSAVRLATRDDLAQILGAARRNNRRDGVTGLLMYHDGTFLQILEGEETAVDRVFEQNRAERPAPRRPKPAIVPSPRTVVCRLDHGLCQTGRVLCR